jgi:hypothetical protein
MLDRADEAWQSVETVSVHLQEVTGHAGWQYLALVATATGDLACQCSIGPGQAHNIGRHTARLRESPSTVKRPGPATESREACS